MSKRKKDITPRDDRSKAVSREAVLKLITLILVTAGIFAVYRITLQVCVWNEFKYFELVLGAYLVIFTAFIVAYIVYNRGMTRKNLTPEMLPDEWGYEKKLEYIEDGERRLRRSSWMLMVIIGFIFTFAFELLELYALPYLENLLS